MTDKLTNDFRKDIEEKAVSEQEMLERDQRITYLRFKNQKETRESNCAQLREAITRMETFSNEIFQLPDSEARTAILEENKRNIEQLEKQLEANQPNRAQEVLLSVLAEKFEPAVEDDEPVELRDD